MKTKFEIPDFARKEPLMVAVKGLLEDAAQQINTDLGAVLGRVDELDVQLQKSALDSDGTSRRHREAVDGKGPFLPLEKKAAPHFETEKKSDVDASKVRFGALIAAIAGGESVRKRLEADEQKSLLESTGPTGGYLIPEAVGSIFIDAVRPQTRLLQAGALTYPMLEGPRVKLPGWDELIEASWRSEGGPFGGESDPKFRQVVLDAKTCGVFVDLSIEILQDAGRDMNAISQLVEAEMGRAIAQAIDLAGLHGAGSDDEPLGLYNNPLVTQTSLATNGATPGDYSFLLDAMYDVESENFTPSALIWNPRTANTLRKLPTGLTGDKTQLRMPAEVAALSRFATNQVRNDLAVGNTSDDSAAFVGDFSKLVIGFRPSIGVSTLRDPYTQMGDKGAVRIYAWVRADIATLQPKAFSIKTGIRP